MTKPVTHPTKTRKVPAKALCFSGEMSVEDAEPGPAGGTEPVPIRIRARTSGLAYQAYWGQCVHDMQGYIPPVRAIAINYNHDRAQLIGTITEPPRVEAGDLIADGTLVPFSDDDIAAEVIHKGRLGVPYQASIQLDLTTLVVEEVETNLAVEVNGQTFTGPVVVFRQWGIEAISVTPFGADGDTSIEFARGGELAIRCFSSAPGGTPTMTDVKTETEPKSGDFEEWVKETFSMDVTTLPEEQQTKFKRFFQEEVAEDPKPEGKPEEKPKPEEGKGDLTRGDAKRMLTDFGAPGAVWYAEGKTYDQAAALFRQQQDAKIKELEAQNADLAKKSGFHRGHPTPAAFVPPADPAKKPNLADFSGHSDQRRKLIAAIKMPGQQ